jgi:signal transduction histidine kinase
VLASPGVTAVEARFRDREYLLAHRYDSEAQLVFVFGSDVTQQKRAERALAQSERMATLGTLAAGVAHELNNPAAATRRAAEQLREAFIRLEAAHQALARMEFTEERRALLTTIDGGAREHAPQRKRLSGIQRIDREGDVEDWLDEHDVDDVSELAPALVGQGLDPAALDRLAEAFSSPQLRVVLEWAASVYPVHTLLYEIGQGATRISEIVSALKSYSFLGQAPVQWINLHEGIDNTLVILRTKLKDGIEVVREYDTTLPAVPAFGSELNQVWTNLLDNAADAMGGKGQVTIRTRVDGDWAVVEIEDNGPGIPASVLPHVFDPFFTTKEPGKGTGLGLSTTYSIVTEKHAGRIAVESKPGATRFIIYLPLQASPGAPTAPVAQGQ